MKKVIFYRKIRNNFYQRDMLHSLKHIPFSCFQCSIKSQIHFSKHRARQGTKQEANYVLNLIIIIYNIPHAICTLSIKRFLVQNTCRFLISCKALAIK